MWSAARAPFRAIGQGVADQGGQRMTLSRTG
jgi:hypothetical protein